MHRAAMPVLAAHNLTLDFRVGSEGNLITVQPILRHNNGYIEEGAVMKGPADTGPGRNQIQSLGSASSYLKRYVMKGILNLIEDGEDDDGMGVARPDYQLNDRQLGLIVDAQSAYDRGEYGKWFGTLSPKDKAVLIGNGTHSRLGGAPILPGAQTIEQPEQKPQTEAREERRADPPKEEARRDPPPAERTKHDVGTAEGWTAQYIEDCGAAKTIEELDRVKRKGASALGKLSEGHQKLYDKADAAEVEARERLSKSTVDGGLFGGDQ